MNAIHRNLARYRTPAHYRLENVVHVHDVLGGAWCCVDSDGPYGPPIAATVPLTCLWCLTGLLGGV